MFKSNTWEFRESVYWPGKNSTYILTDGECETVIEDTVSVVFVHPSGVAIRVYHANIREVRGAWVVPTPELVTKPKQVRGSKTDR